VRITRKISTTEKIQSIIYKWSFPVILTLLYSIIETIETIATGGH